MENVPHVCTLYPLYMQVRNIFCKQYGKEVCVSMCWLFCEIKALLLCLLSLFSLLFNEIVIDGQHLRVNKTPQYLQSYQTLFPLSFLLMYALIVSTPININLCLVPWYQRKTIFTPFRLLFSVLCSNQESEN